MAINFTPQTTANTTSLYNTLTGIVSGYSSVFNIITGYMLDENKKIPSGILPSSWLQKMLDDVVQVSGHPSGIISDDDASKGKFYVVIKDGSDLNENVFRFTGSTWINMTDNLTNSFITVQNIRFIIPDLKDQDAYAKLSLEFFDNQSLSSDTNHPSLKYDTKTNDKLFKIYDASTSAMIQVPSQGIPNTYKGMPIIFYEKNLKKKYFKYFWSDVTNAQSPINYSTQVGTVNGVLISNSPDTPDSSIRTINGFQADLSGNLDLIMNVTTLPTSNIVQNKIYIQNNSQEEMLGVYMYDSQSAKYNSLYIQPIEIFPSSLVSGFIQTTELPKRLKIRGKQVSGAFFYDIPADYITYTSGLFMTDISQALAINNLSEMTGTWTIYFR